MRLTLREIDQGSWEECIRLRVAKHQVSFTPPNVYSLAESKFLPDRVPLGIYANDKMIGLLVCSFDPESGDAWIHRLMIDADQQSKGYTRAPMKKIIRRLSRLEGCRRIGVKYPVKSNDWGRFYERFGFQANGQRTEAGDVIAWLSTESEPTPADDDSGLIREESEQPADEEGDEEHRIEP